MLIRNLIVITAVAGLSYGQLVIPSGTKVSTRLEQSISSATAQEGQSVNLSVSEDVRINDVVVIAQGATVQGTVIMAKERGRLGKSGKLDFSIDKVRAADGEYVPLRYTPYKKAGEGKGVTTGVLTGAAAVVFWPAAPVFLLMKGKDVTVNKGVTVEVFTDADHTMKSAAMNRMPALTAAPLAPQYPAQLVRYPGSTAEPAAAPVDIQVPVTIDADVDGADIEVDGAFVGSTPSTRMLTPGNHRVAVRQGGDSWERVVNVQPGDAITLRAKLAKQAVRK